MGVYIGLGEESKEISGIYLGSENSVKEVSEGYISDADGNLKEIYTGAPDPGQQVFTTSGTFTVPKGVKSVDVFLVGAGGGGGYGWAWLAGGNGGGGGYTITVKGISVSAKEEYPIVVGAGILGDGGSSSAFNNTANGGYEGHDYSSDSKNKYPNLANGGSGGGWAGSQYSYPGAGGSDGSNGWSGAASNWDATVWSSLNGGKGQGSTTRAFGESSGTLYSGGGGGGTGQCASGGSSASSVAPGFSATPGGSGGGGNGSSIWDRSDNKCTSGINGTGGGGGGRSARSDSSYEYSYTGESTYGGSGCVIVRWGYK